MKHNRILAVVLMTALTACTSGKRDYDATGTFEGNCSGSTLRKAKISLKVRKLASSIRSS